jgi:hypothetical protein
VLPYAKEIHPWQLFRDTELWTLEVNDLLEANLSGLDKLYKSYCKKGNKKTKFMPYDMVMQMLTFDTINTLKFTHR